MSNGEMIVPDEFRKWYDATHTSPMPHLWRQDIALASRAWEEQDYRIEELQAENKDLQQKLRESVDYAMTEGSKLQTEVERLRELLAHAKCLNCDGDGAYYDNEGGIYQCQWCAETNQALEQSDE